MKKLLPAGEAARFAVIHKHKVLTAAALIAAPLALPVTAYRLTSLHNQSVHHSVFGALTDSRSIPVDVVATKAFAAANSASNTRVYGALVKTAPVVAATAPPLSLTGSTSPMAASLPVAIPAKAEPKSKIALAPAVPMPPVVQRFQAARAAVARRVRVAKATEAGVAPSAAVPVAPSQQQTGLFDGLSNLFNIAPPAPANQALAYAAQPTGAISNLATRLQSVGGAAVYDIEAHTVTLPSGARLEAHSGQSARFGSRYVNMEDDSRYANVQMHGVTPPATYKLSLRESPFHGVQALRLTPISGQTYGRSGLLAHTYMLGPYGESNGCISFKDYQRFLKAYRSGEIDRVVVVGHNAIATPDTPTPREHGRRRFAYNR